MEENNRKLGFFICAVVLVLWLFVSIYSHITRDKGVSGEWQTDRGDMVLVDNDGNVTGSFGDQGGTIEGHVTEHRGARLLSGVWKIPPASDMQKDMGTFQIIFSDGSKAFTGGWRYGFAKKDLGKPYDNIWNGKKKKT